MSHDAGRSQGYAHNRIASGIVVPTFIESSDILRLCPSARSLMSRVHGKSLDTQHAHRVITDTIGAVSYMT